MDDVIAYSRQSVEIGSIFPIYTPEGIVRLAHQLISLFDQISCRAKVEIS